jgi:hypothetical protein
MVNSIHGQLLGQMLVVLRLGMVLHSWWRVMKKCLMVMNRLRHS